MIRKTISREGSILVRKGTGKLIVDQITERLGISPDFVCHEIHIKPGSSVYCIFITTIVSSDVIDEILLKPIQEQSRHGEVSEDLIEWLRLLIPKAELMAFEDASEGIRNLLEGHCLLIPASSDRFLCYDVSQGQNRSISEPSTESSIRGPREGFVEDIARNVALIRKRLKSEHLVFEQMVIGTETRTKVYLCYVDNIASSQVVDEFRRRLKAIHTDSILESSYIEEWIQDTAITPFPQLTSTERPDSVVAKIIEGQVGVLTDGTPIVLIGPITFFQLFNSPEDYYQRADFATLSRWLRMFAFLLAIFTPALYIAVVSYHQELLPTSLLISLAAQREEVPFPVFFEAAIMTITFEILREAGLRMPRIAGQSISIVGALVLGEAAVEAGLVSAAMVIVTSLTAISNFVSPNYSFGIAQRIIQFAFMLLAGFLGLFGLMCGVFFLLIHLVSLRSFGVKYMSPIAPIAVSEWKDTLVRVPRYMMKRFPKKRTATK
ncbi:spore germination protein [Cohnella lupini]|uniref:Spore germination protein KA n=1 Tax=Cohnella lupini TaxID=1294267 RepID=A0A3D9IBZ4_9BACL|nr:spore germination protein [Cohnella lupini]RED59207.1 spore germination protein KA [Cohnella lupini]